MPEPVGDGVPDPAADAVPDPAVPDPVPNAAPDAAPDAAPGTAPDATPGTGRAVAALARAVATMDRLRSPGGCPWYAGQTHESLLPYAVEEAHELVEAVEAADRAGMREELADLLLQVLVHARVAADDPDDPFDVTDVADALVAKLVRRNPHVFAAGAGDAALDARAVDARWELLKRAEKPARTSALDGVPASLGALARAQKLVTRADRAGLLGRAPLPSAAEPSDRRSPSPPTSSSSPPLPPPPTSPSSPPLPPVPTSPEALGDALLALVAAAHAAGIDAEAALRGATTRWETTARREEPHPPTA